MAEYIFLIGTVSTNFVNQMWITLLIKTFTIETMLPIAKCLFFVHLRMHDPHLCLQTLKQSNCAL